MNWDWGDVPSWIAVILAVLIPLVAYIERNRIAGFFRRKATEPLPETPPARFNFAPLGGAKWALINMGAGEGFNVRVDVESASASVGSSGFWPRFLEKSYGSVDIRLDPMTAEYGSDLNPTTVIVSWHDANGVQRRERHALRLPREYPPLKIDMPPTQEGKVVPLGALFEKLDQEPE